MKKIILLLMLILPFVSHAQKYELNNRVVVLGGFSNKDSYNYGAGYHLMVGQYFGIGAYVGAWSVSPSDALLGDRESGDYKKQNPYLKPSVILKTKDFIHLGECGLYIACEPAMIISGRQDMLGKSDNNESVLEYKTDCISWAIDFGAGLNYKKFNFHVSYGLSSLDINRLFVGDHIRDYSSHSVGTVEFKLGYIF